MSAKLPQLRGAVEIKAFENAGFSVVRVSGSHHIMKAAHCPKLLSVPVHGSKPVKRGTLDGLIKAAGLTVDKFLKLL